MHDGDDNDDDIEKEADCDTDPLLILLHVVLFSQARYATEDRI